MTVGATQAGLSVFPKWLLISWDFHTQQSLEFTQNGVKIEIPPMISSAADRKTLQMKEVRGERLNSLEVKERLL